MASVEDTQSGEQETVYSRREKENETALVADMPSIAIELIDKESEDTNDDE
jgi:hypothetical protein